ncbi:MAG: hypothetical protein QME94_17045, partial [Anaerolineae bacterium]|nr:hypothetical protein [Anaerolineae bacterium]
TALPEWRSAALGELWHALQAPPPRTRRHLGRALRTVAMVACLALAVIIAVRFLPPLLREASSLLRSAYQAAQSVAATPTQIPPVIAPTRIPMTVTPVPTARPTLTPTLPEPTATAVPPPTVTPTRAPTPQPRPSPSPAATVRRIQPPAPLAPEDGAAVSGAVEFRWYWPEPLAPDECFDLQVWRLGTEPAGIAWCRETSYRVSAPPAGPGDYLWRVQVIRVGDGQVRAYLSEPGAQRSLRWLAQE